jgi:hypothetical protein
VPGSGVTGTITAGGSGATVTAFQVTNASGTVVCWAGSVGGNYGFWASSFWVGGTGPSSAKIWLDSSGNAWFTGGVNSGSTITGASIVSGSLSISTSSGTVAINSGTYGINVSSGGNQANVGYSQINVINSGGTQGTLTSTSVSVGGGPVAVSELATTFLNVAGVSCINASGQFVGTGVYCPSYGVAAAGFNPFVGGTQYYGQNLTYQISDTNGGLHTVKGGVIVT